MSQSLLNKLLLHSFKNYQTLFNELTFHNHNAHHLGSLYLLGASDNKLEEAYETMCKEMDPYESSPEKITLSNWRQFLGNKHFCKSYADFFHEQLTTNGNNWQTKFNEFLLENKQEPLINGVIGGVAHPLIHIGYAYELNNEIVGAEALTMAAVCYNYLHKTVDQLQPPNSPCKTALEIFHNIRSDIHLPIYDKPGVGNLEKTVKTYHDLVLSHYNQWKINTENIDKTIEELFDLSVYVYGATHKSEQIEFDFFLLHLLTSMHAIRMIRPHIDDLQIFQHILFQYFYFAIILYITQLRPEINEKLIHDYSIDNSTKNWNYVIDRSLNTALVDDAHLVKIIRALRDAEQVYGNKNDFYLKMAVKTVDNMNLENLWIGG